MSFFSNRYYVEETTECPECKGEGGKEWLSGAWSACDTCGGMCVVGTGVIKSTGIKKPTENDIKAKNKEVEDKYKQVVSLLEEVTSSMFLAWNFIMEENYEEGRIVWEELDEELTKICTLFDDGSRIAREMENKHDIELDVYIMNFRPIKEEIHNVRMQKERYEEIDDITQYWEQQ